MNPSPTEFPEGPSVRPDGTLDRLAPRCWIGGSPLRLFRLTDTGDTLLTDLCRRGGITAATPAQAELLDRLVLAGAAHPRPDRSPGSPRAEDVTVVVPVRDRPAGLDRLLGGILGNAHDPPAAVVVVDDGSVDAAAVAEAAARHGATLVRHDRSRGPAAARNSGLSAARTPIVAFVDSDIRCDGGWLGPLLAHLVDPRVAMVAPRVRSLPGPGPLSRYEMDRSPLDLGPDASAVRPRGRVSYVPAAALVARVDVVRSLGGFDEQMRFGEDVDLVWRAVGAGHLVRYEPEAEVFHEPRPDWLSWASQRFAYGSSAAELDRRHPTAVAPVVCSPWSAAAWTLVALGHPVVGAAVGAGSALALALELRGVPPVAAAGLAVRGHMAAGAQLARACIRPWWPVLAGAAVASRRGRRIAIVALVTSVATSDHGTGPRLLAVADDMIYGAGVWWGAARSRRLGALLPVTPGRSAPGTEVT